MDSNSKTARFAGAFYLAYIMVYAFSTFVQSAPIVWGDAATTARNILAHVWLFRVGFMSELIAAMFFLLAAWALFVLFKPASKELALLFLLLNLTGVAIECGSALIHFGSLLLLNDPEYLKVLGSDNTRALAMLFLNLGSNGNVAYLLFYGIWLFPLGYLVIKSGIIPQVLGVLLILDGIAYLICSLQLCLFPGYEKFTYPLYPVMFIAECGLAVWLLIKGTGGRSVEGPV